MKKNPNGWISVPEMLLLAFLCLAIVIVGIAGYRKWREARRWEEKVARQRRMLEF